MATDDPYVYVYEDGYTSDEEDISESLVTNLVDEAFRNENLHANRNHTSHVRLQPSDTDLESANFNHRIDLSSSDECIPMIKITGISDEANDGRLDITSNTSVNLDDIANTKPKFTVSDGYIPEKNVRFMPETPVATKSEKKKYPTTPKCAAKILGPTLTPLKSANQSTPEPETPTLTSVSGFPDDSYETSLQDTSETCSTPQTGFLKKGDFEMVKFEEDLVKLNCAFAKIEEKLRSSLLCRESRDTDDGSTLQDNESVDQSVRMEGVSCDLKDMSDIIQVVRQSWTNHKKQVNAFLHETQQLETEHVAMEHRIKELNDYALRLRGERRALEEFLQEKEYEWFLTKKTLRADTHFIRELIKEAQQARENNALWKVLDSFLLIYFDREKAIALDTAKQNKINELRLLICSQQLHLAELEERNRELEVKLGDQKGQPVVSSGDRNSSCCSVQDVLYCDHSFYSPLASTNPEYAALHTLNIGGPHPDLVYERKEPVNSGRLFRQKFKDTDDLEEFDHFLLKELTEHGPGSQDFRLE